MSNSDFPVVSANYDREIELFSERNQLYVSLLPKLMHAMNETLVQISMKTGQHLEIVLHMLSRLCCRHYEAIFLLASCGHGYSAGRIMRSMFEKFVDAQYIYKNPSELDDFWDYFLLSRVHRKSPDELRALDPDYETKTEKFYFKDRKGRPRKRLRWSKLTLIQKAESLDLPESVIEIGYRMPNELVHSSLSEIFNHFVEESDGTISPVEESSPQERKYADLCVLLSTHMLHDALNMLVAHFKLVEPPELKQFYSEFKVPRPTEN